MGNMKDYTNNGYLYIRKYNPYVDGIIGADIKLTLKQKIRQMRKLSIGKRCLMNITRLSERV